MSSLEDNANESSFEEDEDERPGARPPLTSERAFELLDVCASISVQAPDVVAKQEEAKVKAVKKRVTLHILRSLWWSARAS